MTTMTLSGKRQVVLPADLCRQVSLAPGARVSVELAPDGNGILVRSASAGERKPDSVLFDRIARRGKPLAVETLTVDRAAAVSQAIAWYRRGMDFSDALHLAQSGLCSGLATFDTRFAKTARRLGLEPHVSAPG